MLVQQQLSNLLKGGLLEALSPRYSFSPWPLLGVGEYTILYYTILYYTILYYTILYYTILYYTIIYYNIL